jgi:hypothetical protein
MDCELDPMAIQPASRNLSEAIEAGHTGLSKDSSQHKDAQLFQFVPSDLFPLVFTLLPSKLWLDSIELHYRNTLKGEPINS